MILDRQQSEEWGAKVIDRLAQDLQNEFPGQQGLSPRNLKYMRVFAEAWPAREFVQASLAQITWYYHLALLDKLASAQVRLWYAEKTVGNGWSRNILAMQIDSKLRQRQGKAVTNFLNRCNLPCRKLKTNSLAQRSQRGHVYAQKKQRRGNDAYGNGF